MVPFTSIAQQLELGFGQGMGGLPASMWTSADFANTSLALAPAATFLATSAAPGSEGVVQSGQQLASAPSSWLADPAKVQERVKSLLAASGASAVVDALQHQGVHRLAAQRACLELQRSRGSQGAAPVSLEAAQAWLKQHADLDELNR